MHGLWGLCCQESGLEANEQADEAGRGEQAKGRPLPSSELACCDQIACACRRADMFSKARKAEAMQHCGHDSWSKELTVRCPGSHFHSKGGQER